MAEGGKRRSARLSALDACKAATSTRTEAPPVDVPRQQNRQEGVTGQKKRGRKKRSLEDVVVNSVKKVIEQEEKNPLHDDCPGNDDKSSNNPFVSLIPEKRKLELILDLLQKRDKHNIFAEPVDPEEVEGYYDIIKNPMDFGTMRAKLQEGMYTNLVQFENDVFLIFSNAMHFNSSTTIFFKQARAIQEIAKKIFYALRTDPENFESECLIEMQNSGRFTRKAFSNKSNGGDHGEFRGSDSGSHAKLLTDLRQSNINVDFESNGWSYPLHDDVDLRRNLQGGQPAYGSTLPFGNRKASGDLSGSRDGRRPSFFEEDHRCSYRPWSSFLSATESTVSMLYNNPSPLIYVNKRTFSYTESLLHFVADLGPTAKMVAHRKIQKCQVAVQESHALVMSAYRGPVTPSGVINLSPSQDILGNNSGHASSPAHTGDRIETYSTIRREAGRQIQSSNIPSPTYFPATHFGNSGFPVARTVNSGDGYSMRMSDSGMSSHQIFSRELPSELSQSRLLEFVSRNNNNVVTPSTWSYQAMMEATSSRAAKPTNGSSFHSLDGENQGGPTSNLSHTLDQLHMGPFPALGQPQSVGSHAVYDVSYVQAQIGGYNSRGRNGFSRQDLPPTLTSEMTFLNSRAASERAFSISYRAGPSTIDFLDNQQPDLALQL